MGVGGGGGDGGSNAKLNDDEDGGCRNDAGDNLSLLMLFFSLFLFFSLLPLPPAASLLSPLLSFQPSPPLPIFSSLCPFIHFHYINLIHHLASLLFLSSSCSAPHPSPVLLLSPLPFPFPFPPAPSLYPPYSPDLSPHHSSIFIAFFSSATFLPLMKYFFHPSIFFLSPFFHFSFLLLFFSPVFLPFHPYAYCVHRMF